MAYKSSSASTCSRGAHSNLWQSSARASRGGGEKLMIWAIRQINEPCARAFFPRPFPPDEEREKTPRDGRPAVMERRQVNDNLFVPTCFPLRHRFAGCAAQNDD